ncbi:hypothetical protein [Shewanella algae]|uniref:hypothetical protein n=1 Tax=Shewanella algae TaxID=38313 RepID=UPI001655A799|nr:hypothetical protein [Shewanella algae]MBC8797019.1 hypothetical protein [Shewanella algae]
MTISTRSTSNLSKTNNPNKVQRTMNQQLPKPEQNNPFAELYSLIYKDSLAAMEEMRPERTIEQSEQDYEASAPVQAFQRRHNRLYKNLIAINRLASQKESVRTAAAALIFKHLPKNGEAVLSLLQQGVDLSSAGRFKRSMNITDRNFDDALWHFPDLNNHSTSGFAQFCNSLPPLSLQESKLANEVADSRVLSKLDAVGHAPDPSTLGLPAGLSASEKATVALDFEARNIRLVKLMDRLKVQAKNNTFCADLVPTNRAGQQYKEAFAVAGKMLWQSFARDSGSSLFGRPVLLALITRSLEALAVSLSTEQGAIALQTHTPELTRAFAKPSTAQAAMNVILSAAGGIEKPQMKLDALEHALASTAWAGNHSISMTYALEALQAGALAQLSDRELGNKPTQALTESIASGVYADMRQPLLGLD